jgi:hypothetical protein
MSGITGLLLALPFIGAAALTAVIVLIIVYVIRGRKKPDDAAARAAGRAGEKYASDAIRSVLREGDQLFTNVSVSYKNKVTELDNVVVNRNGVFIIEVKYYSGRLAGDEDDFEWSKYHTSRGGNTYVKTVKNPIKQVSRQVYILAGYLKRHGVGAWVDGYAIILGSKSPVKSGYVLKDTDELDKAVHTPGKKPLDRASVESVSRLLKYNIS